VKVQTVLVREKDMSCLLSSPLCPPFRERREGGAYSLSDNVEINRI